MEFYDYGVLRYGKSVYESSSEAEEDFHDNISQEVHGRHSWRLTLPSHA